MIDPTKFYSVYPVGSKLHNIRFKLIGEIVRIKHQPSEPTRYQILYDMDTDHEYFWCIDEVEPLNDMQFLALSLKYGNDKERDGNPHDENWYPGKVYENQ